MDILIPDYILADKNLTLQERVIYGVVFTWTDLIGEAPMFHDDLINKYSCSHPARILKSLVDKGYIKKVRKSIYTTCK